MQAGSADMSRVTIKSPVRAYESRVVDSGKIPDNDPGQRLRSSVVSLVSFPSSQTGRPAEYVADSFEHVKYGNALA